jgi:hypothetical protein
MGKTTGMIEGRAGMSNNKLLPCPFCGNPKPTIGCWSSIGGKNKSWIIECKPCMLSMGECYDKKQLIQWWNTRKEVEDEVS